MEQDKINKLNELFILYLDNKLLNRTLKRIIIDNWSIILNSEAFKIHVKNIIFFHETKEEKFQALTTFYSCLGRFQIPISFVEFTNMFGINLTKDSYKSNQTEFKIDFNLINESIDNIIKIPIKSIKDIIDSWKHDPKKINAWEKFPSMEYFGINEFPPPKEKIFKVKHEVRSPSKASRNWRKELAQKYKVNSTIKQAKNRNKANVYETHDDKTLNTYIDYNLYDENYDFYTIIVIDPDFALWTILSQRKTNIMILNTNLNYNTEYINGINIKYNEQIYTKLPYLCSLDSIVKICDTFITYYENYPIIGTIDQVIKEEYGYYIISRTNKRFNYYLGVKNVKFECNLTSYEINYINNDKYPHIYNDDTDDFDPFKQYDFQDIEILPKKIKRKYKRKDK